MKYVRNLATAFVAMLLCMCMAVSAFAAEGNVVYSGDAGKFVFEPGSKHSPSDLFADFKDVMPGDTISQKILIKNKASNKVQAKIYLRALGAHDGSADFLSQLQLDVEVVGKQEHYASAADQAGELAQWKCLGTFDSGDEAELNVTLTVPTSLESQYMDQIGMLDWEFMVEEIPVAPSVPQTGDAARPVLYLCLFAGGLIGLLLILLAMRRKKK